VLIITHGTWRLIAVVNYRMLCKERSAGNPNFGYPEAGYDSGWSSRSGVLNKHFGYCFIDIGPGFGIEPGKLLPLLKKKYVGDVFLAVRENGTDIEYTVAPYYSDKDYAYPLDKPHLIVNTSVDAFVEIAEHYLVDTTDNLYVWPDGEMCTGTPYAWKSDDYICYEHRGDRVSGFSVDYVIDDDVKPLVDTENDRFTPNL